MYTSGIAGTLSETYLSDSEEIMRNVYEEIMNEEHKSHLFNSNRIKELLQEILEVYDPYKDSIFNSEIRSDYNRFHQRFFEAYISYVLINSDVKIKMESYDKGPDIIINDNIYIECTAPTNGDIESKNSVTKKIMDGRTVNVLPETKLILRLSNAFTTKSEIFKKYEEKKIINLGINIIAISGSLLEWEYQEDNIPRIVKLLFGIGHQLVNLNRPDDMLINERRKVEKLSGSEVKTDLFLNQENSHISGVIFSVKEVFQLESGIGNDLILIKNHNARRAITDELNFIKFYRIYEYCDGEIRVS